MLAWLYSCFLGWEVDAISERSDKNLRWHWYRTCFFNRMTLHPKNSHNARLHPLRVMPGLLPVSRVLRWRDSLSPGSCEAGRPSAPCQTPITAWASAVDVSKGLRGGATHPSAFHTFVLLLFIYQVSLPARVWYPKIEGLCESLTVSVTGSHRLTLFELLPRWSNRNLGNLMLQLSEPFPKEKLKRFHGEGAGSARTEKSTVHINAFFLATFLLVHMFSGLRSSFHLCALLSRLLKLNREPRGEKLNYHLMSLRTKLPRYKLKIGYQLRVLLL